MDIPAPIAHEVGTGFGQLKNISSQAVCGGEAGGLFPVLRWISEYRVA